MKLVRVKTMRLLEIQKVYVKNLNAGNAIQNMSLGFKYIDADGEERPQCLLCMNILAVDSIRSNKLKRQIAKSGAECVGKTLEFLHRKLNAFNNNKNNHLQKLQLLYQNHCLHHS